MKMMRIKDNTYLPKAKFEPISQIRDKIADKTLEELEKNGIFVFPELIKDSEDFTKDQMILKTLNNRFLTSNIVGFLGYKQERLVITSRFGTDTNDYFFQYMLEKVMDYPNILDLTTDINQDNHIFSLFLFLFPYYLKSAMRKGVFKTYIHRKYNNANVKGTIDISRHIRENTPFLGKVAYNQREFSYDNDMMELIRHTIEFIKTKPFGPILLRKINEEVHEVVEITKNYRSQDRNKIVYNNKKKPLAHAYYHEYRSLQRLCIAILQYEKHQMESGNRQIQGILFDAAWLWEEYINTLIKNDFYHPRNKGGGGAQYLFSKSDNKIGLIYPDFISRDKENRVIADAKYKPVNNIQNKDYLQVLAYMFRFDAKKGYYIYPDSENSENLELKVNSGTSYERNVLPREDVKVIKYGLFIPSDVNSYSEFVSEMKKQEKTIISDIKKMWKS